MRKPIRVLFLVEGEPRRGLSPASRFRVYQYLPYLEDWGVQAEVSPSRPAKYFMGRARWQRLARYIWPWRIVHWVGIFTMIVTRLFDIARAKRYDVIVIQRSLLPVGLPPFLETWISRRNPRVVFDFDDAIFRGHSAINTAQASNGIIDRLRQRLFINDLIPRILRLSRAVVVGNAYLADYAENYASWVEIVPTTIELSEYSVRSSKPKDFPLVIGWIGTATNLDWLQPLIPIIETLASKHQLLLRIVSNIPLKMPDFGLIPVDFQPWSLEREAEYLNTFDVGLMPLPDNPWTRGKCGLKILQYMAAGIPVIASPVGVNADIIHDGLNGFLAQGNAEWATKLDFLISDSDVRRRISLAGRTTVEATYTAEKQAPNLAKLLHTVADTDDDGV